tara:strand:+ start:61 stop:981 length:921 start_codon:yes stop_codon:yes gene_type:complete
MTGTDILLTIIILIIFIVLFCVNILAVGIENIKNEWPKYRCNPIVMPIANVFGKNTLQNFTFCVQNLQQTFMQDLLAPLHYVENIVGDISKYFTEAIHFIRAFFNKIRNMILDIIKKIMAVFLNFLIGIQHMIISIKDLFSKTIGTLAVFMYVLEGAIMSMKSAWAGLPGQMVRMLCFHPNTLVKLKDGTTKTIATINPGDILKNDQVVHGTMKLHNLDEKGNYVESLYQFDGENTKNPILVSGSHLIFDKEKQDFIHVKDHSDAVLTSINSKELICLITSDHTIPLGNYIFHDWEDNQGSPSKNV